MNLEDTALGTSSFVDFDPVLPDMRSLILDYLACHGEATFVDLEDDIPGFCGELTLRAASNANSILWRGLSPSAVHALRSLHAEGSIALKETSFRIYKSKGRRLQLPVARAKPFIRHWVPVLVALRMQAPLQEHAPAGFLGAGGLDRAGSASN